MKESTYVEATKIKNRLANYNAREKHLKEQREELREYSAANIHLVIDPPRGVSVGRSYNRKFLLRMFDAVIALVGEDIKKMKVQFEEL